MLTTPKQSNIKNLSATFRLSPLECEVLERGLSFIPTPSNSDRMELCRDMHVYHRRLKLLDYFLYDTDFPRAPFTNPSKWEPRAEVVSHTIQTLIQKDIQSFLRFKPKPRVQPNFTSEQLRAVNTLKNNNSIVIKPADKGSQIVIMDKVQYLLEAERQLSNVQHYVPLPHSIQTATQEMIREILTKLRETDYITDKQMLYLMGPDPPRPRLFYLLPKIHKPPETWTVPFVTPSGRPIVSDCGSESYRVAEYIDSFINPLSQKHPSYVKDTYDFVAKVKTLSVPAGAFLFSIDINSLYTNIDTQLGLQAVARAFERFPDERRPDQVILELLELSLVRNDFEFNDKFYLQIHGTAMGKKFAPAFANLYMCFWEETAFPKCKNLPLMYLRYLDDIFGVWTHSLEDFHLFLSTLNSHHPAITITHNTQQSALEFLDTQVFFVEGTEGDNRRLATKVFFKDTDRHALLHKSSHHPKHTFRGLIKSQLIRFHRICSFTEDVEKATQILFKALGPRGYSKRFLRSIKTEVKQVFLEHGNFEKAVDERLLVPLVCTYSPAMVTFCKTIKTNFQMASVEMESLQNIRVISAYRRNRNLGDILVHSRLATDTKHHTLHTALKFHKYLFNKFSGLGTPIWQRLDLKATNVVYVMQCGLCKMFYVGETRNSMGARLKQHLYHIGKGLGKTLLYRHFLEHSVDNLTISGAESNPSWSTVQRQQTERGWIKKLGTIDPLGLNERF